MAQEDQRLKQQVKVMTDIKKNQNDTVKNVIRNIKG